MFRQTASFFFFLVLMLFNRPADCQNTPLPNHNDSWKLEKDKNSIQVYSRPIPDSRLKEVKVQCEINGTLAQLVAFISDIDRYKDVVYRVKDAYILRRVSDHEFYYYNETSMPWPVHNRDLVLHVTFHQDDATKVLFIKATNAPEMMSEKPGIVRVPFWYSLWTVHETDEHRLKIQYIFRVDPGGELPVWLINATVAVGPYQSFSMVEDILKQPQYQEKTYSFLRH